MNLNPLLSAPLTDTFKGIPGGTPPFPLNTIGEKKWNVLREDLPLPLAVIKRSALEHNSRWMQQFLALAGVKLAPHGKTTMAPQLFARQLADGAWGMTFATASQVRIARDYGVQRIILANQLIGRANIAYILDELARDPQFDFYCLADSLDGVEQLADAAKVKNIGRPVKLLLEAGAPGARCGCRDLVAASEVASRIKRHEPYLALCGVEAFEGSVSKPAMEDTIAAVSALADFMLAIARHCEENDLFAPGDLLLSAGGSAYYDVVAQRLSKHVSARTYEIVIRSGCYLTHDSVFYHRLHAALQERSPQLAQLGVGLQPALEVWAYVQSRPEPERAILTAGKRDASFDLNLPVLQTWYSPANPAAPQPLPPGHTIVSLNDQHAICTIPASSPLSVGDMVSLGISHPCTTFDRWQWLPVVDEEYNVVEGVRTFF